MKKIIPVLLLLAFLMVGCLDQQQSSSGSWAYDFVRWEGKSYVIDSQNPKIITSNKIGKRIGEVEIFLTSETDKTKENASNKFVTGTKYFSIKEVKPSEAIAVKNSEDEYIEAISKEIWHEQQ